MIPTGLAAWFRSWMDAYARTHRDEDLDDAKRRLEALQELDALIERSRFLSR